MRLRSRQAGASSATPICAEAYGRSANATCGAISSPGQNMNSVRDDTRTGQNLAKNVCASSTDFQRTLRNMTEPLDFPDNRKKRLKLPLTLQITLQLRWGNEDLTLL
ncbi:hypothetical protein OL67_000176 [Phaeobacter piscinae]|nr:hypothetical protein OL67_000176 [Phaeobacter piscinae]